MHPRNVESFALVQLTKRGTVELGRLAGKVGTGSYANLDIKISKQNMQCSLVALVATCDIINYIKEYENMS